MGSPETPPTAHRPPGPKRVKPPPDPSAAPAERTEPRSAFFDEARHYAKYVGVDTKAGRFVVSTADRHMGKSLFLKRARPEFKTLDRAVTAVSALIGTRAIDSRLFVDVGANIGSSTVAALVSHRFGAAVSCEPEAENYRQLRANIALNDLGDRVRTLRVAVSNTIGHAQLVVHEESGGFSWIAVDPDRIRAAEAGRAKLAADDPTVVLPEMGVTEVELVTLDWLVETGVIDLERAGMLWVDTEGHEGYVLEGANSFVDWGVPTVLEFDPATLDERGDRAMVHEVAEDCYTHFVDVRRRETDPSEARFQLRPVAELRGYADRFLDPARPGHTDLLLMRLDPQQAAAGAKLPDLFA